MLLLCLKIVSLSLQLAVTAQVLEHLRLPFEFRRWRYAWRAMLVASLLMTSKRIYDFWDVVPFATIGMNMTTDLAFLYALWNLRVIFMRELGAPLLDPVAHVTIDQHSQIVAWDATATRLFGWDATDAIGRTLMQTIMCSRDWEAHRAGMARYLASGDEGRLLRRTYAAMAQRKDGLEIPIEVMIRALPSPDPAIFQFAAEIRALVHL